MNPSENTTICAPATPVGAGAVSLLRVSGPLAIETADKVVRFKKGCASQAPGYSLHFGSISETDGALLDEVLVSVFRAPHSYTGEDMVEICCHASGYIVERILSLLCKAGASPAEPGEFTRRAFLNGKMDLSQAEAVADLIASSSRSAHDLAIRQMKGGYSEELGKMRDKLLHLVSLMELELDFSEEEVEFADRSELMTLLDEAIERFRSLADSFRVGNALKNGIPTAIAGAPNSGKSTLLNALTGQDRAIVSDIAGTTRDTIEESCQADGILFRFIDTAGLRDSTDTIERLGIERSWKEIGNAQAILAVLDLSRCDEELMESASDILRGCRTHSDSASPTPSVHGASPFMCFLLNKADLERSSKRIDTIRQRLVKLAPESKTLVLALHPKAASSAFSSDSSLSSDSDTPLSDANGTYPLHTVADIKALLASHFRTLASGHETLVSNFRHAEALRSASEALIRTREGLLQGLPTDLCCQDIREALHHLGSITGQITSQDVLNNIFSRFCIGK